MPDSWTSEPYEAQRATRRASLPGSILYSTRSWRTRGPGLLWARAPAAALVATAGAIHLYLWFDYFHRVHVVGTLFLINAGAGMVIAATLVGSRAAPVLVAGIGYSVTTLAAFAVSTKWGLFGYHERFWATWQEAAGSVELAATLLLFVALVAHARSVRMS